MYKILLFLLFVVLLQAGAICDFKIKTAKEGLQASENAKNKDEAKIQKTKKELEALQKHCDDEEILAEVKEHIKATKNKLNQATSRLNEAYQAQNQHLIFQAKLQYKIAHIEYIAARQEELRLKDLARSNQNGKITEAAE